MLSAGFRSYGFGLALLWILTIPQVLAQIRFGAEFTMTNEEIIAAGRKQPMRVAIPEAVDAQKRLLEKFSSRCLQAGSCWVIPRTNPYGIRVLQVKFRNPSFWVQISTDPAVVEIQTRLCLTTLPFC